MQRVLSKTYAERDVSDVETHVRDTVRGLGAATPVEEEQLVAKGIFLVRRITRALPPEASLQEALRDHLAEGLSALRADEGAVRAVLADGATRARAVARETLDEVKARMGFLPPIHPRA